MKDKETDFLSGLLELQYGVPGAEEKLGQLAHSVLWAKGWPQDIKAFWNAEAFMWGVKIDKERRELIAQELEFLKKGKNLDLGCGAYSYLPSVGFDISPKMLDFNEQCTEKIIGSLEKTLPLKDEEFNSVTAIFVLNYIINYQQLLREIKRIIKADGTFVAVLYSGEINEWQRQKEVNAFSKEKWRKTIEECGFLVTMHEKEKLVFFRCS